MIRGLLLALLIALPGCAAIPASSGCDWAKPIYVGCSDVLTNETAIAIKTHDETGAKKCGWKPKRGAACPKSPSN